MSKIIFMQQLLRKYSIFLALTISILYAVMGSIVSVIRFFQYDVFYYDFGIFDKAIWSVSRFSLPIIDHMSLGETIIFADHFSPSIFLLSPFFLIFPQNTTLLVLQACAVAASGFVLFLIGKHLLSSTFSAFGVMLCYFLFVGLQNAIITDFHEVTLAILFFMLTYLFILKQKRNWYILCFLLFLGCKETLFLVGIGISITIFFIQPTWRKIALFSFIFSLLWGVVSIKVIIPYFSGGHYLYTSEIPTNPLTIVSSFFDSPIKRNTLFYSFVSFGFLPLLSPSFWFLLFQDFLVRFYPHDFFTRWGLGFHYSAVTAAIMGVSSLFSIRTLQKYLKPMILRIGIIILILNALFLYRVILRGPFALAYNPAFYTHTSNFNFLNSVLLKIPKHASIMTQNNLVSHFTHQKTWLLISDFRLYQTEYYRIKKPDYILIDNHPGQNPNDFFGVQDISLLLTDLQVDPTYTRTYFYRDISIYKRVSTK